MASPYSIRTLAERSKLSEDYVNVMTALNFESCLDVISCVSAKSTKYSDTRCPSAEFFHGCLQELSEDTPEFNKDDGFPLGRFLLACYATRDPAAKALAGVDSTGSGK